MSMPRRRSYALFSCLALLILFFSPTFLPAQVYSGNPKLIVIVVIDQFRGDYLNRFHSEFKGRGFRLFTDEGAWFTNCYYDYANTKTAPGHATIGTGAYSDGHGIETNEWWDTSRDAHHKISSVEDERYQLVDVPSNVIPANLPNAQPSALKYLIGSSPRNLRATTLGDELRLATQGKARVFGVSLKDRASILPSGQSANAAYWLEPASGQFTTSTYYMEHLPEWVHAFNASDRRQRAAHEALADGTDQFFEQVGRMPAANSYELDFAQALIQNEHLGQNGVTDEITISLSANDIEGHAFGPDSPQEHRMVLGLDHDLDAFFTWLDKTVGLKNVWLALSADHGVAPVPSEAAQLGISAVAVNMTEIDAAINTKLNERFSPGSETQYLMPDPDLPYITLNKQAFEQAKVDEKTAEDAVAALVQEAVAASAPQPKSELPLQHRLPPAPRVQAVYTRLQLAHSELPPSEWGRRIAHSYADHGNWFVMAMLDAYQIQGSGAGGTTHYSPWSYDRHVPLAFYGAPFAPGEYRERVAPVDLAATFASLAGVNQPSASVGRVLTEALKPTATAAIK
ncbi:alkaline phosphatase family protein [Occallatibacter riparius]|uniref:Alkaline phosphatase family protein n=1 Tax=Occallatibacter riparius TaxID=1002689 RepID=A0A9J7BPU7_9BACT|nr:alkaline phosphatase family protein [Occallatibacter riparius]UWZ82958.1 alkaline phosphatase family protein [Occallatibacter riparius]